MPTEGDFFNLGIRNFSVTDQHQAGSWYVAQMNPPLEDPSYHFVRGNQWLNKRNMEKALDELGKSRQFEMMGMNIIHKSISYVPCPMGNPEAPCFDFHLYLVELIIRFVIFGSVVEKIIVFRCG